jgi:hypothetical protein
VERIVLPPHLSLPAPLITSEENTPPPRISELSSQPWAVIDRAPDPRRALSAWRISVDGGPALPVTHDSVVLGRNPSEVAGDVQMIVVPDLTRTVSKVHVRLVLGAAGWTVTDLGSTNGVVVVGVDGGHTDLDAGASAPVVGELILGKVTVRVFQAASGDTW